MKAIEHHGRPAIVIEERDEFGEPKTVMHCMETEDAVHLIEELKAAVNSKDPQPTTERPTEPLNGKIRLLKWCRRKTPCPMFIYRLSDVVIPVQGAIYETTGIENRDGKDWYTLRLIGAFKTAHIIGDTAFLPVSWFNDICEWIELKATDPIGEKPASRDVKGASNAS